MKGEVQTEGDESDVTEGVRFAVRREHVPDHPSLPVRLEQGLSVVVVGGEACQLPLEGLVE